MKTIIETGLALAASLLLAACATPVDPGAVAAMNIDRGEGLSAVNAFRAENGLKPLTIDERLMQAAAWQSAAMATRDRMDHAVAGALPGRVETFGYRWSTAAENIGRAYKDYDAAMVGWIHSPSHRKNLLNPNVTEIGFAGGRSRKGGPAYWTQILASPNRTVAPPAPQTPFHWGAPLPAAGAPRP